MDGVCKKFNYDNVNFGVDPPPPLLRKAKILICLRRVSPMGWTKMQLGLIKYGFGFVTYGVSKDTFFFFNIGWVLSLIGWRRIHLGFVIYGWVLSHMGSAKINLVFVKYGLGFVTWGQRRYTRDLSNMAWVLSIVGWKRIQFSFVIYGWGLSWVLSYMGSIQQQQLFMNSGRLG